jgi:hypothetical protein
MRQNKFLIFNHFAAALLLAVVLSACSQEQNYLPQSVAGSVLNRKLSGDEARAQLDKIHLNPVMSGKETDIGFYVKEENNSTIYVTYYKRGSGAEEDFEKMTKKISPVNSVFIAPSFFELNGHKIYRCFGMGQTHFVFTHKDVLVWISTGTISANDFLKEYIELVN